MLFVSSLLIFMLHVATLRTGRQTTPSRFATLRTNIFSLDTFQVLFWYNASAWWFGEVFVWSSSTDARLGWVIPGSANAPDRLNERPIYIRAMLLTLALVQSVRYVIGNYSCVCIPVSPPPSTADKDIRTHRFDTIQAQLHRAALPALTRAALISSAVTLTGPVYYQVLLRQPSWRVHLALAKLVFNLSRANARPVGYPPSNPILMFHSFRACLLLMLTWETTSILFSIFLLQEPLKKGQPLSASSKDPNGTLLNGLKAKRDVVKAFAFWELTLIAQKNGDRRKAIFSDIERQGGTAWSQMLKAALEVVSQIDTSIKSLNPPPLKAPGPGEQALGAGQGQSNYELMTLPRLAPDPLNKPIFTSSPAPRTRTEKAEAVIGPTLKRLGQSPRPYSPPIKQVQSLLEKELAPKQEKLVSQWHRLLRGEPLQWFFGTSPRAKANSVILGSPLGNANVVVDAVEAVTKISVASLSEDVYGKTVAGVPEAVRVFTKTICSIEQLLRQSRILSPKGDRLDQVNAVAEPEDPEEESEESENQDLDGEKSEMYEVIVVLDRLKAGLAELLSAFQLYLADVGLGISELNEAKKAAEKRSNSRLTKAAGKQRNEQAGPLVRVTHENEANGNDTAAAATAGKGKKARTGSKLFDPLPGIAAGIDGVDTETNGTQDEKHKKSAQPQQQQQRKRILGSGAAGVRERDNVFGALDVQPDRTGSGTIQRQEMEEVR